MAGFKVGCQEIGNWRRGQRCKGRRSEVTLEKLKQGGEMEKLVINRNKAMRKKTGGTFYASSAFVAPSIFQR